MLIWVVALAVVLVLLNNFVDVAGAFRMEFKVGVFVYYVINYVVGLMTFLSLYAGFAVSYEDSGKASSALLPVYFAILFPFYTFFSLLGNPANAISEILSITPLTSLYVMPARMALISVPVWQPVLAIALNLCVLYLAVVAASRLYRISILSTGNSPSLRQLVIWARTSR
jgi:ABC-2 type transport system permease protein